MFSSLQKKIILAGAVLMIILAMFPPRKTYYLWGYQFVCCYTSTGWGEYAIDWPRYLIPMAVVLFGTIVCVVLTWGGK